MRKVFFVDDSRVVREMLKASMAGDKDIEVVECVDGADALSRIIDQRPDLVVADLNMPRLDGMGLLTALKRSPLTRAIPVVILTSSLAANQAQCCRDAGAREVLLKPVQMESLRRVVRSTLGLSEKNGRT